MFELATGITVDDMLEVRLIFEEVSTLVEVVLSSQLFWFLALQLAVIIIHKQVFGFLVCFDHRMVVEALTFGELTFLLLSYQILVVLVRFCLLLARWDYWVAG